MDRLENLVAAAPDRVAACRTLAELEDLEQELTGRGSVLAELRRGLGGLPPEDRPDAGSKLNQMAVSLAGIIDARRHTLQIESENALLEDDKIDVTVPGPTRPRGTHHLLTQTMWEVTDIFRGLGYQIKTGPEVETTWYNFDALNTPLTHPSRFESDTLYVDPYGEIAAPEEELLLRAHTSPMQIRHMEANPPPVYIVVPGRVFRQDTWDATHAPVFHQIEGLAVDDDITFADLKGTLAHFAKVFFGAGARTRFVPDFFPFTEPSAQMLVSWGSEKAGHGGWLELLGCGMVDPNVFEAVGYNPNEVTGFAFGMGVERLAMVRHGISDIRVFTDPDARLLRQFR